MDVVVKDVYGSWCLVLGGDGGVVGYCWDILARVPVEQVDVVGAMGVGRVKEEKGVVWHKIEKKVPKQSGRKEMVLDLAKFGDKGVQVKLTSGRQVTGTLKGYDQLLNLILDEVVDFLKDPDDPLKTTDQTRNLGLIVSSPLQHQMSAKIAPSGS
ncbi:U6 snRNA-associated Sm-like protein LSm7 [Glycine soja]|nr:U6 snRNA-associated Sm-like protein LSm7 [Glycine soja]|eukprot:XP_025981882.1 U6 snRNA-associated Sm-like protein LSm7 [Glycine max]